MQDFSKHFPQDPSICYLNHAAVSPWPLCTGNALKAFAQENTVFGASHYLKWLATEQELRKRLAKLINISDTDEISLAKSTSEALSIIAYGIDWQAGDEVVISSHEFPSNRIVWESLAQFGVKTIIADVPTSAAITDPIDCLQNCISKNTRLVSISSVQYASGLRIDLEALSQLCQKQQILLCVDAIQSLGAIPFDQDKIHADFIVADGHKWMMAAEGLALLYIKKAHQNQLKLNQFGWHMIKDKGNYGASEWEPANDGTRFECGSPNMLGIHTLNASLGLIHEIGIQTIAYELDKRMCYLTAQLSNIKGLTILSPVEKALRGGIITFKIEQNDSNKLYMALMKEGVICACRGGGIRFSPHFYTPKTVMDSAVKILKALL
ncbi:MAG: cysteine desulfurase/selenocysteine lyase [Oleiphilaceae bacterium]|jgi:cysteine desulfurase/selenocysteine lyase